MSKCASKECGSPGAEVVVNRVGALRNNQMQTHHQEPSRACAQVPKNLNVEATRAGGALKPAARMAMGIRQCVVYKQQGYRGRSMGTE